MPPTAISRAIGQAIRARRLARDPKFTLKKFASEVGVSVYTAWAWESGEHTPTFPHLVGIAEIFGCSPNDLLVFPDESAAASHEVA